MSRVLTKKNSSVQTVVTFLLKIAPNMEKILFNSNVNIVAQLLNGFVGETHIFVSLVIKSNVKGTTYQNIRKISFQNVVELENVQ